MKKTTIKINHNNIQFEIDVFISQWNNDKWLIWIHGLQSNKKLYLDFFSDEDLSGFSKLAIDLVGFWDSSKSQDFSYDIYDQSIIVQKIIEALNIESFHLIGHSLGWMVWTLLLEILGIKMLSFVNLEWNLVWSDCWESKNVANQDYQEFSDVWYEKIKDNLRDGTEPSFSSRLLWVNDVPNYAFYKTSESIVEYSEREELLHKFIDSDVRKVFVVGDKNMEKIDSIKDKVDYITIKNSGHFMYLDNPDDFNSKIKAFILWKTK